MGTTSTTKYIKNNAGALTEEYALITSIQTSADANRVPALNANGVLDATIVNSKTTSTGASDSGKVVALDSTGRIDTSCMPVGIGADTATIITSETLVAGDLVNVYSNGGVATCRKADASTSGKEAHGFVLTGFSSAANAVVYFEGTNTQMTSLTPGRQYLSAVTPGKSSATAPTATGQTVQIVGFAVSTTAMNFQSGTTIVLA